MKESKELLIVGILSAILVLVVLLNMMGVTFHPGTIGEWKFLFTNGMEDEFVRFAVAVNFIYSVIPNTFQLFSISGITVRLLQLGFSPLILGFVIAVGGLISQLILYFIGLLFYKYIRKKKSGTPGATHFLHKYHYLVFLIPSWTGSLGDLIMLISGHERVSLLKAVPLLFGSNLAYAYFTVYWINAQL